MTEQHVEYRVMSSACHVFGCSTGDSARKLLAERLRNGEDGPYWIERRTVTTTPWEKVEE